MQKKQNCIIPKKIIGSIKYKQLYGKCSKFLLLIPSTMYPKPIDSVPSSQFLFFNYNRINLINYLLFPPVDSSKVFLKQPLKLYTISLNFCSLFQLCICWLLKGAEPLTSFSPMVVNSNSESVLYEYQKGDTQTQTPIVFLFSYLFVLHSFNLSQPCPLFDKFHRCVAACNPFLCVKK